MEVNGIASERDHDSTHESRESREVPTGPTILPSADDMKERIRKEMTSEPYDVSKYYHRTGFSRWIATHPRFEQLTLVVIALNALWIWIDTDANPGPVFLQSPPFFQIVEHLFCFYFTYEWTMRYRAFKRKRDGLKDFWFIFDSLLVSTMVFETWVMTAIFLIIGGTSGGLGNAGILRMARLLRLTRMARMARLLRAMPELLIIIKGMVTALRSVAFTLGLLLVILYIFGILFRQLCEDSPCEEMFPTVLEAMHVLLVNGALMDSLSFFVQPLQEQSIVLLLIFYVYLLLAALTVMNMLLGVICEVVSAVAVAERETLKLSFVKEKMQELMFDSGADEDNDGYISKAEFQKMLGNGKATNLLRDVGVDVVGLLDFADAIFDLTPEEIDAGEEEKQLTFADFMNVILDMRGSNTATFKDIVELRKNLDSRFKRLEKLLAGQDVLESQSIRRLSTSSWQSRNYSAEEKLQQPAGLSTMDLEKEVDSSESGCTRSENPWVLPRMIPPSQRPWSTNPRKAGEVATVSAVPFTFPDLSASARELLATHECRVTELRQRLAKLELEAETRLSSTMDRLVEPFSAGVMPVLADCGNEIPKSATPPLLVSATGEHLVPSVRQDLCTGDPTDVYSWSSMRRARQNMGGRVAERSPRVQMSQLPRPGCVEEDSLQAV
eukprot:CAMPEP_0172666464 /NCGR_PEP_ID=MMETSP1074-20121228/7807_1 /TAXON_ID=2916 /ORGANISM="Ceratium fusus, Strain PA161109" /LENGTH=666 /DNA_ID=CAMNT_0013482839 /DNA_START=47 /DNA_END=2047 /DNA_ORIENTATION=+